LAGVLTNELNADLKGLRIQGTNGVPADCQLLIVAGPRLGHLLPEESEKIETYLQTGGRMFLLLDNSYTNSGAEALLSRWGVEALNDQVNELNDKFVFKGIGFSEAVFCRHPIIDPIQTEAIVFNQPRPFVVKEKKTALGEPSVMLLAASSDKSALAHGTNQAGVYTNLLIAIEKDVIKGVRPGGTRILALGDASLLANNRIDLLANGVFAGLALNWLLERPDILMSNLPARPIPDYKLMLSTTQFARLELFFLVGLPGLIFLVGSMVWLRRRH